MLDGPYGTVVSEKYPRICTDDWTWGQGEFNYDFLNGEMMKQGFKYKYDYIGETSLVTWKYFKR